MLKKIIHRLQRERRGVAVSKGYTQNSAVSVVQHAKIAVVLHLFYPEMWDYFNKKLQSLDAPYDLYVSIPEQKRNQIPTDLQAHATVFFTPNHGRDVLPFLYICRRIQHLK
jgi:lipopolysaccharide biosynthesis protein